MIFMMVVIHTPMRWYDRSWVEGSGELQISGLTALFFLILIFFSAWAGLFLMVSSIGNMISMQRNLDRFISKLGFDWDPIRSANLVNTRNGNLVAFFRYQYKGEKNERTAYLEA